MWRETHATRGCSRVRKGRGVLITAQQFTKTVAVYVEKVYEQGDFAGLGIGT